MSRPKSRVIRIKSPKIRLLSMLKSWKNVKLHGTIIDIQKSSVKVPDKVARAVIPEEEE